MWFKKNISKMKRTCIYIVRMLIASPRETYTYEQQLNKMVVFVKTARDLDRKGSYFINGRDVDVIYNKKIWSRS